MKGQDELFEKFSSITAMVHLARTFFDYKIKIDSYYRYSLNIAVFLM
jgi:hypothetical protein